MKTFFGAILLALATTSSFAQDITGTWHFIDDKTGEPKALVKIEKQSNNTYAGTVLKLHHVLVIHQKNFVLSALHRIPTNPLSACKSLQA